MAGIRPIALGILLAVSFSILLTTPLYANPSRDDDCLSCHTSSGITINSNVAGTLKANASSSFDVQVIAEGSGESLTVKWPSSVNPSFTFLPSTVADNGPNDRDPIANKVNATFKVNTPVNSGDYTIRVFAADGAFNGATLSFEVQVTKEAGPIGPGLENMLPTAYFLYNRLGMTVQFEDRSWDSDGSIATWHWSFGDNVDSTQQSPAHTFMEPGTYTVVLTVTDDKGGSNTQSHTFAVPSRNEQQMLWGAQILIGSLMIVFTSVFAVGIASARSRRRGNNG